MLRNFVGFLLIIFSYFLQSTLFQALSLGSISPNLILILVVSAGFVRGKKQGVVVGFFSGLLIDCFSGGVLGFHALIYLYIGLVSGFFHKVYYEDDVCLPLVLIGFGDLGYSIIFYGFRFLLRNRLDFGAYFMKIMLPEVVYTVIVAIVAYRLIFRINKLVEAYEKRRETKFD